MRVRAHKMEGTMSGNDVFERPLGKRTARTFITLAAAVVVAGGGLATGAGAVAQEYPDSSVTMFVGFAPGGGSDVTGRIISEALEERLGEPVVVENRPGAGSTIAADHVANSEPDGYTLMYMSSDGISLGAALRPDLTYEPLEDFDFIARMVGFPYIIAVHPDVPVESLEDLVEYAEENPNAIRYGSSGVGSGPQMATELIAHSVGIELEHVAFDGAAPAATAAVGGHIEMVVAAPSTIQSHYESDALRVIGVTGEDRHPNFPDAPTLAEAGLPENIITIWWGVVAPAGTPEPAIERLRSAMADIAEDDEVGERLSDLGYDIIYLDAPDFREFAEEDIERWTGIARDAEITLD